MQQLSLTQQQVFVYYQKHFLLSALPKTYFEDLCKDIATMDEKRYNSRHFSLPQNEMAEVLAALLKEIEAEMA